MDEYRHWIDIKTRTFLDRYPDEEWGNAHIVLADDNYYDGHLDWVLAQDLSPAARRYIQWLRRIPEIFRPTFWDCDPKDECLLSEGKLGTDNDILYRWKNWMPMPGIFYLRCWIRERKSTRFGWMGLSS